MRAPVRMPFRTISPIPDRLTDIPFMKHRTEKRFDTGMKFFTPELYLLFNSVDDNEADQADELWEKALDDYSRHLHSIKNSMPFSVVNLSKLILHDAELILFQEHPTPLRLGSIYPFWVPTTVMALRNGDSIVTLFYFLWETVRRISLLQEWPFSTARKHWLYDELDNKEDDPSLFIHRILFSHGEVMEIPFINVIISTFDLKEVSSHDEANLATLGISNS